MPAVIFLSYWFIWFALAFFPVFYLVRHPIPRLGVLALSCIVFHFHFGGPAGVLPIVVLAVVTYLCGISHHPALCMAGIALNIAALLFYKYTLFLAESLSSVWTGAGSAVLETTTPLLPTLPPLAISFFVFEFVHYLVEVRRGGPPIYHPLHFGFFAVFWPSLVAGPIKRYQQFIPALLKGVVTVSGSDVAFGLLRVAGGMLKKTVADSLTLWIDVHAARFESLDLPSRWLFLVLLAMRIYLDFSGYSDIAIGYARMMGVRLPENFNWPYIARSITEFWRRWHISLSSWIFDYIYVPLGGNRRGLPRKILNGIIAFAICGLWHGAAWNFVLWGLYHGAGLAISANYHHGPGRPVALMLRRVPGLAHAMTFLFVAFGWLLFFYPAEQALRMFVLLFTL